MLLNDFFEIMEMNGSSENKLTARVKLNEKHPIFQGHFPDNPITPGVVQIQMVKELLEHFWKKELNLVSISRCKFLKILNPNENPVVTFHIDISSVESNIKIGATGEIDGNTFFKMNAVYQ